MSTSCVEQGVEADERLPELRSGARAPRATARWRSQLNSSVLRAVEKGAARTHANHGGPPPLL
jgi:hypothetical protein